MVSNVRSLIVQGGGTRGVFATGVLDVIAENGISFDMIAGTSAGALSAYNFVSGDIGRTKKFVIEIMPKKEFASFHNRMKYGSFFNFRYMFEEVPKTIPFNYEAFKNNPIRFYCGTTDVKTGKAAYFEKSGPNFDDAIAACSSLPLVSKPVKVGDGLYLDGCNECPVPYKIALEEGYEKLVIVLTRTRAYRKKKPGFFKRAGYSLMYHKYPEYVASCKDSYILYNDDMDEIFRLENEGKAFVICPEVPPTIGRAEKDGEKIEALYQDGRKIMNEKLDELKEFLGIK